MFSNASAKHTKLPIPYAVAKKLSIIDICLEKKGILAYIFISGVLKGL